MERFHAHISTRQSALEKRLKVLHAVSMYPAIHELNSMVNDLMQVIIAKTLVTAHFIGEQSRAGFNVLTDDRLQGMLLPVGDYLSVDTATALQESHNDDLILDVSASATDAARMDVLVHVPGLAANKGFIGFNFSAAVAAELHKRAGLHGLTNAVKHEPSGFLSHAQG